MEAWNIEQIPLCPKCQKEPRMIICGVGSYIRCPWCDTGTPMQSRKEDAVNLWNKLVEENSMENITMILFMRLSMIRKVGE